MMGAASVLGPVEAPTDKEAGAGRAVEGTERNGVTELAVDVRERGLREG